ncbi:MAG: hypothetical protein AUK47_27210 [Deltaproteobacteria bacterium CG2_30_63_29]|nr:MAG: hypothetical protein AUK47_27210 [Deltaproteobacteria bacterium CG2_30_63_29]
MDSVAMIGSPISVVSSQQRQQVLTRKGRTVCPDRLSKHQAVSFDLVGQVPNAVGISSKRRVTQTGDEITRR